MASEGKGMMSKYVRWVLYPGICCQMCGGRGQRQSQVFKYPISLFGISTIVSLGSQGKF